LIHGRGHPRPGDTDVTNGASVSITVICRKQCRNHMRDIAMSFASFDKMTFGLGGTTTPTFRFDDHLFRDPPAIDTSMTSITYWRVIRFDVFYLES
jgi:hypothetical protein